MTSEISVEALAAIGKRWQKGDMDRIYFNGLSTWYGLDCNYYNSGNVSSATHDGEKVSNTIATAMLNDMSQAKVWYDVVQGKFFGRGFLAHQDHYIKTIATRIRAAVEARAAVA